MTETEWLTATDPAPMLRFVTRRVSDRKLRLYACACCRRVGYLLTDARSHNAVEAAERHADGLATDEELANAADLAADAADVAMTSHAVPDAVISAALAARNVTLAADVAADYAAASAASAAYHAATATRTSSASAAREAERAAQCRLLREIVGNPFRPALARSAWLHWNDGCTVKIAQAIYEEGCWADLPILADALEDAGCSEVSLLDHLRGPGPHFRGCHVLDVILGKS